VENNEPRPKEPKPLGRKNYGSIGHLPNSRIGPGDHHVHSGQAEICCSKARDKYDRIIVTEKLDGSNCGVARIDGEILALGRAGYLAQTSKFEQHQLFASWVRVNAERFRGLLRDGERAVGEWMAQAHGTRYSLPHEPFVIFDVMTGPDRASWDEVVGRCRAAAFTTPHVLSDGPPFAVERLESQVSYHGALDQVEGAVWRVERTGQFDFMAKWVRPDKEDGKFLAEVSLQPAIWNWRPEGEFDLSGE
jgi:RNA ligase